MPPSGYSADQTNHLGEMLRSCSRALRAEAAENAETFSQALEREIASIKGHLATEALTAAQRGILLVTQGFYAEVLTFAPKDVAEFSAAVERAALRVEKQMLSIKIPTLKRVL
jgi:hypothetical protein